MLLLSLLPFSISERQAQTCTHPFFSSSRQSPFQPCNLQTHPLPPSLPPSPPSPPLGLRRTKLFRPSSIRDREIGYCVTYTTREEGREGGREGERERGGSKVKDGRRRKTEASITQNAREGERKGGREGRPADASSYPPGDLVHTLVHDELLRLRRQVLPQQILREVRVGRHLGDREDER